MPRPKLAKPNYRLRLREHGKSASWVIDWTEQGKPRSFSTGTDNREDAEKVLAQHIALSEKGDKPIAPTIDVILDGYLANREGHVASHETLKHSAKPIRRHIGKLEPHQLKSESYWERRREDGVAPGTILREGVTLRAALAWARKEKWIPAPEPYVALPPKPAARDRWLSREEADRLLAATLTPHMRLFVLVALSTAARKSAITELTWDRVHLDRRTIDFRLPGRVETSKRRAIVPINETLMTALAEAKATACNGFVIEYHGRPAGNIKKAFERAAKRAGVLPCSAHTLRHTAATWMVVAGVPLAQVARFLGDTEEMVERVYGHHSPDYLRGAAKALDRLAPTIPNPIGIVSDDDSRPRP